MRIEDHGIRDGPVDEAAFDATQAGDLPSADHPRDELEDGRCDLARGGLWLRDVRDGALREAILRAGGTEAGIELSLLIEEL